MAKVISGKKISEIMREEIKSEAEMIKEKTGKSPGLAVVQVGDNHASTVYVNNKKKACEKTGIKAFGYNLPGNATHSELLELINTLNEDSNVHGILCQLPLPDHMNEFEVLCAISPEKDVDGFHPYNVGLLSIGKKFLVSCTPAGILEMLLRSDIKLEGKECVIVGRSNIVGKPVAQLMISENCTVTVAHSRTKDLKKVCQRADILIAAVGRAKYIDGEFIKKGAVVVDVGINRGEDGKVVGDVDFESASLKADAITPVPFGVGPMTITMLLKNTLTACKKLENI